jgi:hypothetical protein
MTSNALRLVAMGVGLADAVGPGVSVGVAVGGADGLAVGDAVAATACSVKLAHGLGCTLAHS